MIIKDYPPPCDLWVGDLVFLKEKNKIGIVVKISYDRRYQYPATNAYVLWGTNEESWCLGEALIVLSKANEK